MRRCVQSRLSKDRASLDKIPDGRRAREKEKKGSFAPRALLSFAPRALSSLSLSPSASHAVAAAYARAPTTLDEAAAVAAAALLPLNGAPPKKRDLSFLPAI